MFLTKTQISNFSWGKKREDLAKRAPIPLGSNDRIFSTLSFSLVQPLGVSEFETPICIPVTLAEGKLDEGNKSCLLLQPPIVDAGLNGYLFHIVIF